CGARAAQDRGRSQELDVLRHRHPRRSGGGDLQPARVVPPPPPRSVPVSRRGHARLALLARRAIPRAGTEALVIDALALERRRARRAAVWLPRPAAAHPGVGRAHCACRLPRPRPPPITPSAAPRAVRPTPPELLGLRSL